MPQSLIHLPESADFVILGCHITIWNHKITSWDGLVGRITDIIRSGNSDRDTLYQFEKHGISFETAIRNCIMELKDDADILGWMIRRHYDISRINGNTADDTRDIILDFSKSEAGRIMAAHIIEKIKRCNSWQKLYSELHQRSEFSEDMKNKIIGELKQQCRKV